MKRARTPFHGMAPAALKTLCACIAAALPALAAAQASSSQDAADTLPAVKVEARGDSATTEGTDSYTTGGGIGAATPLGLSLRETPQAVTVVTQQRIQDQGAQTLMDVANSTTGVSFNQYETNRGAMNARGFSLNRLLVDGVPTSWEESWTSGELFTSLAMYDRVEVVRGATGLTSGTGDPSAAINLVRKRATARTFTGSVEVDLGRWNQRRAMVDLSTPLNKEGTVRGRLVAEQSDKDSWVDLLHSKTQTLYATVEADLTRDTLLRVGASRQKFDTDGPMWGGLPYWYADGSTTDWPRSKTTSASWTRWPSTYSTYFAGLEHRLGNGWKLKLDYNRGERKSDSYLLYLYGDPDAATGLGLYGWPGAYRQKTVQDDLSAQASGPFQLAGRTHELSVGYTYANHRFDAKGRSATPALGVASDFNDWTGASYPEPAWGDWTDYESFKTRQQSVQAAARFSLADPLRLIVGGRLTGYEAAADFASSNPYRYRTSHEFTPYLGAVYDLNSSYSLYASYTGIFQPQNKRDTSGQLLDPTQGKSVEAGVKGEFLDGRINTSASVFHIRQDNFGVATGTYILGSSGFYEAAYAPARVTSRGFELEATGELAEGWNLSAGYTQFKLTSVDGEDVNTLFPRKVLRLFTTYRLPGALGGLTVGGGVNWQSDIYTWAYNPLNVLSKISQKSYALVSLMARYEFNRQWSAQINVNNVFDKKYYAGLFDAFDQVTYGAPRNVVVSMKYKF
ncbi:MAG: TonB-dependent siderophore receptor [Xenophilus sp.]